MATALQPFMPTLPGGSQEAYLTTVHQIPVLTLEEEQALTRRFYEDGDLDAARQLVMAHLRFVVRIAQGFNGYGLPLMDLVQEGNVGLMKAVKRFDPNMGVRLVSFAVHWIKAEIHEFIIRNWRIVKIATTKAQRKLFFNLRSMKQRLTFSPDEAQSIANDLGVTKADVLQMDARFQGGDFSLDTPIDEDNAASAPMFTLVDPHADPAKQIESTQWREQGGDDLHLALADLDERSRRVLTARWLNEDKSTLHELAAELSVSAERVRQIEQLAMKKLKTALLAYQD